ncbi:hypothetical protein [[Pseudopropionibacterium] massiliense]|uniref:hypothetical protein n=1 Tax=[Pseudopropionibacterium] massiliense TaxID=2220000 RepID=UPI00103232EC|nr:hypothetical protein [[Pseudopropionibacterium] massiliense]
MLHQEMGGHVMKTERAPIRNIGLGMVLIGREPVAPAGAVAINLPGAVLDLDPARPDLVPSCLVGDVGVAEPGVEQVFGRPVARGLLDVVSEEGCGSGIYQVCGGEALGLLRGLAEIRWCRDNSDLLLDPLLLDLEELTLLGRLAVRIEVDREWREPLLALLGFLARSPEVSSRIRGHPASRNLLLEAADVLTGTAIPEAGTAGRPQAPRYALAAGGMEAEEEDVDPCPPQGPGEASTTKDARRLTAQGVFDLRLCVVTGDRRPLETGLSALEAAMEIWRAGGAGAEAGASAELLDLARDPAFPASWPVRPSVAERVHARTGTKPGGWA